MNKHLPGWEIWIH